MRYECPTIKTLLTGHALHFLNMFVQGVKATILYFEFRNRVFVNLEIEILPNTRNTPQMNFEKYIFIFDHFTVV